MLTAVPFLLPLLAGVACLVERLEAGGRADVERAAAPAPFISVFTSDDVKAAHLAQRRGW